MANDEIEGRLRAIEAILVQLPEVTAEVISAARGHLRGQKKRGMAPEMASALEKLSINGKLDNAGEDALDAIGFQIEKRSKL